MLRLMSVISFLILSSNIVSASVESAEEYIELWKEVAIEQMNQYGVPASITLAQGILESAYGNSMLAVKGNNHFGIKCHNWEGETLYKDDDKKNECFRKYDSAKESFEDHSLFLVNKSRYAQLFELEITDYKAWAKGLKNAGYATNPKYPTLLIDIIERYNLNQYDVKFTVNRDELTAQKETNQSKENTASNNSEQDGNKQKEENSDNSIELDNTIVVNKEHEIKTNAKRTKYVVATTGDTFYQLAEEFGVTLHQLHKYNDFPKTKDILEEGDIVYLMPKRRQLSYRGLKKIELEEEKALWEVSQQYGVKLKSLMQVNEVSSPDVAMAKGQVVYLK